MVEQSQVAGFLAAVEQMHAEYLNASAPNIACQFACSFKAEEGPKYIRVVKSDVGQQSAWCFIRKEDGAILKCAGWKAPAKHARGNINGPDFGVSFVGPHGPAYLR